MAPESYLLDTSALLALIEDEEGTERVEQILRQDNVTLPWIVLLELLYITWQERGQAEAEQRYALVKQLADQVLWSIDEPTLLTAGRLKAAYRLSLAGAVIAAWALRHGAVLVHKDPEYQALAGEVVQEALPYKNR
ncbi:MAG: PIN domain-containing protein [Anaerolineales bacterium]|nr:PIN domain-containing protein [Anaerolineales bacterium]